MFINQTETIGIILGQANTTTTGSLFATLLLILIFLLALCLLFRISFEWASILLLPLMITYASYYSNLYAPLGITLIYLSMILTKNFIFK
jgi:hypothetical protein